MNICTVIYYSTYVHYVILHSYARSIPPSHALHITIGIPANRHVGGYNKSIFRTSTCANFTHLFHPAVMILCLGQTMLVTSRAPNVSICRRHAPLLKFQILTVPSRPPVINRRNVGSKVIVVIGTSCVTPLRCNL